MTRDDAGALLADLLAFGRKQTDDLREDIEGLLGGAGATRKGVAGSADRVLREVDRARRVAPASGRRSRSSATTTSPPRRSTSASATSTRRAAQGARLREAQREPQVGARGDRAEAQVAVPRAAPPSALSSSEAVSSAALLRPAAPRRRARADRRLARLRRQRRRAPRRLRRLRRGAVPGDRVRAVVGKAKRAYAEARAVEILEPSPDRIPRSPTTRARRGRCSPTSASSRSRPSRSTTR